MCPSAREVLCKSGKERSFVEIVVCGADGWCRGAESNCLRRPFQGRALPMSYLGTGTTNDSTEKAREWKGKTSGRIGPPGLIAAVPNCDRDGSGIRSQASGNADLKSIGRDLSFGSCGSRSARVHSFGAAPRTNGLEDTKLNHAGVEALRAANEGAAEFVEA